MSKQSTYEFLTSEAVERATESWVDFYQFDQWANTEKDVPFAQDLHEMAKTHRRRAHRHARRALRWHQESKVETLKT